MFFFWGGGTEKMYISTPILCSIVHNTFRSFEGEKGMMMTLLEEGLYDITGA